MATIRKIIELKTGAAAAWDALADFHAVHVRIAPGFVTASERLDDTMRRVTFANGSQADERLVAADPALRRLCYTIASARMTHHNASAEIMDDGPSRCRFVWTTDVLPDDLAPYIDAQMSAGADAIKAALERG